MKSLYPQLVFRRSFIVLASLSLLACSTVSNLLDPEVVDYKTSKPATRLDVPPDLTQIRTNDRFVQRTAVSANQAAPLATGTEVLPGVAKARIERSAGQRWIVVDMPAELVYPIVQDFWKQSGFSLAIDSPQTGVIETDWAENRAKLPQGGLRKMFGGILEGLYDTGERDKYRTRLERAGSGTEIYLSHRGTKEYNASTTLKDADIKTAARNGNVELENEFLRRLLLRFGSDEDTAKAAATGNLGIYKDRARIKGNTLEVDDAFDIAWRRLGLALDRTGFSVEDRNVSEGIYYVRYARPIADEEVSLFKRIFTNEKDRLAASQKLKIVFNKASVPLSLSLQKDGGGNVETIVQDNMLKVLYQELR